MRTWTRLTGMAALLATAAWLGRPAVGQTKAPTVKEVMKKAHQGANSPLVKLDRGLKSDAPDWPSIQSWSRELVDLAAALGKNSPPKGDRGSWDKFTAAYLVNARAIEAGVAKKDARSALAAHGQLTRMCAVCHKAHK
jgi:hypothetical protein